MYTHALKLLALFFGGIAITILLMLAFGLHPVAGFLATAAIAYGVWKLG